LGISGHNRFYSYTRPEIALDPARIAPPDAGRAKGTLPTTCSSFIWLACRDAGIQLESDNEFTSPSNLEPLDHPLGAEVELDTLYGLYLYTAQERLATAEWLYT
jgi:hypothetical protein